MAKWLIFAVRLLVILESAWTERMPEDVSEIVRQSVTQRGVFTHANSGPDAVTSSMFKVYERYSKEPQSHKEGNTVRSFTAARRVLHGKEMFQFNLSTIQDSEVILSASFHFFNKRQHQRSWRFRRPRHPSVAVHQRPPGLQILFHGLSPNSATPLGNFTISSLKKGAWQSRDVTAVIKQVRKDLIIIVETNLVPKANQQQRGLNNQEPVFEDKTPFIILYADDQAIDEPNSVAATLQRYGPFATGEDVSASASRIRRELKLQIKTNEIPEVQFNTLKNHELWQSTYFPAKSKSTTGKKQNQESREVLNFDERTMKKARRRQWSEPRVCTRRYLKVDFADIGWSEWVLAPKSFDAYYCAGSCGFPIPKVVRPSNHATIQSIVRAVGIVPGIPEPCCVPEKMSPLSVLFLDPGRNMVLKVYPGMSVDTCTCR
ncbi:growth/differentiation factor 10b [Corythoichthys intestinalis]|uniref:growth/differentiation factor 10b n=1 Tax=Corythoichthys intestinalis TaxID=161448 RepID=UPI0025A54F81|nr:growth/differentiation factor 10b [Corythoichthys intestinalis]XP_061807959.1 growth/differentiation factor 10-like [Nerophis lumbriciformis]